MTKHEAQDFAPAWSVDGGSLYYGSTRGGEWQIWRLDLATREERQITRRGGRIAQVPTSGDQLYYVKPDRAGLWRKSLVAAAPEELVLQDLEPVDWNNWLLVNEAVYYVRRPRPDEPEVVRFDLKDRRVELVQRVPDLLYRSGLWVARDETQLLLTRVQSREADIASVDRIE